MLDDKAPWRQGTCRYRKGIEKNFNERNILATPAGERASRRSTGQGRSIDYPNAPLRATANARSLAVLEAFD